LAEFVDSTVKEIDGRLRELKDEVAKLEAARAALVGGRRGPGRPRAAQALELVRNKPGITIPQIAESLKIEPNYLYRVMPKLVSDGQVKRDGQGWHPAG
jgi:DNA-binding MarR family transcriptional regulator